LEVLLCIVCDTKNISDTAEKAEKLIAVLWQQTANKFTHKT
jgi:hypothetical protein